MKDLLRAIFSPLLKGLESGDEAYQYKASHRYILVFISLTFSGLATLVTVMEGGEDKGYLIPVLIFGVGGFLGLVVGLLGEDRAIARLWGTGKK